MIKTKMIITVTTTIILKVIVILIRQMIGIVAYGYRMRKAISLAETTREAAKAPSGRAKARLGHSR